RPRACARTDPRTARRAVRTRARGTSPPRGRCPRRCGWCRSTGRLLSVGMRQTVALFRPKSGNKATPYHWVRFSYRGHVYRHSTFTRNEAAARRRGEVWRRRVIEFVDRTGSIPRDADAPMPTAPEETPEVVTIVPDDRGALTVHVGAG